MMSTQVISPEDIVPEAANIADKFGIKITKGTFATMLANAEILTNPFATEPLKQQALDKIRKLAPAAVALGLHQHVAWHNPEIQAIVNEAVQTEQKSATRGKIILYIATSADGFIADKEGGVSWLPQPADDSDIMSYKALLSRIDIILMGSKSYDQITSFGDWVWPDKMTYVFSSQDKTTDYANVHFVAEDVGPFIDSLTALGHDIWLLGGAELIQSFAEHKLIDECIITVIPTLLGDGIKLELPYDDFDLAQTKDCHNGIYQKIWLKREATAAIKEPA